MVRARAPLRISFSGGGTDLPPYADEHGGVVLSATLDRFAYASLRFPAERRMRVNSREMKTSIDFGLEGPLPYDGNLDLIKACFNRFLPAIGGYEAGIQLDIDTEAPPGSGLGASSALVVAVVGAFCHWRRLELDEYALARFAWEIERTDLGIPGGMQDQYAAAFGGFNFIEFRGGHDVLVTRLRLPSRIVNELQYNLMLVFTGRTRTSAGIIESQVAGMSERQDVVAALDRIRALTLDAKEALMRGRLHDLGAILHEEWLEKQKTAPSVSTEHIEDLYAEARRLGAIGGKLSGAGGGGFMFLYCPFDRKAAVSERLTQLGADVFPVA
ncbi:MAG: GHMP kinase, partial [Chloroflexi bacterium]|nr:GHMP kinase [Chloroflexota bacterium]